MAKWFFSLVVLILLVVPAQGTITVTEITEDITADDEFFAITVTPAVGDIIAVVMSWRNTVTWVGISDTQTQSWTPSPEGEICTANYCQRIYTATSTTSSSTTITVELSGTPVAQNALGGFLLSGSGLTVGQTNSASSSSTTAHDAGGITTTTANGAFILTHACNAQETWTPETGFTTTVPNSGTYRHHYSYQADNGATGAKTTVSDSLGTETCQNQVMEFTECTPSKLVMSSSFPLLTDEYEDQTFDPVWVEIQNSGTTVCDVTNSVTVAKGDVGAGTVGGTLTVAAVSGIAKFTDLSHDTAESLTLDFTSGALTAIDEDAVTVHDIPAGNYLWAKDNNSIDGLDYNPTDLDARLDVELDDWTPTSDMFLFGQPGAAHLYITTEGYIGIWWTTDGATSNTCESTAAPTSPTRLQIRATLDVDNGSSQYDCDFYTRTDQFITTNVGWTALGSTVTGTTGTTSINDSKQIIVIGKWLDLP